MESESSYICINVGSGTKIVPEHINFDNSIFLLIAIYFPFARHVLPVKYRKLVDEYILARKEKKVVYHDCRKKFPLQQESVDHILCSHFLEHIYPVEVDKVIDEFRRILKRNGTIHIILPDLEHLITQYITSKDPHDAADELLKKTYLCRENPKSIYIRLLELFNLFQWGHKWMYDRNSFTNRLKPDEFTIIDEEDCIFSYDGWQSPGSIHIYMLKK